MNRASLLAFVPLIVGARLTSTSVAGPLVLLNVTAWRRRATVVLTVFSWLATALYIVGLIAILLALTDGSGPLSASALVLAGTMGDIRVARTGASKTGTKLGRLRRTLRRVGWQTIVLAFVLLDIACLGFTLTAPVWLAPLITLNMTALALGSEYRRLERESAAAGERLAVKAREAERPNLEELYREVQRQREAERLRQEEEIKEAEQRRREEEEREAQRQREAERLRQEEEIREAEQRRQDEEERLLQMEQQREAERRSRQAEEGHEAERQRNREREQATTQSQSAWWSVLDVAPTASKNEIVRNYRRKIQQCHPDRVAGLAPEFLRLAEKSTKTLNLAYLQAKRVRR